MKILRKLRLRHATVISAIATLSGIVIAMGLPPTPPFTQPFAAHEKGAVIETVVRIREHRNYYFMLVFDFKAGDVATRVKIEDLLSENYIDEKKQWRQREPRLLHLQVWEFGENGERLVSEKKCRGYEDSGAGNSSVEARFASLKLLPGKYRVRVESLSNIVGFSNLPVQINFSIGYHPNSTPITN